MPWIVRHHHGEHASLLIEQVQVRVTIAGLNPHDQKGRDIGLFTKDSLPALLGSDVVGVVTVPGEGATRFKKGDSIFGQASIAPGSASKATQQYAVLDEDFASIVPDGVSEDDCATLPTNILAGLVGFFDKEQGLGLPNPWSLTESRSHLANSSILIVGGGSNCGRFATQLAKLVGFGTVVVVGGKEEELRRYGATNVVDRHGGDDFVLQRIRDIVGDDLVYAFDAFNAPVGQHLAINALSNSKEGTLARLVWSRGAVDESKIHPKQAGYVLKGVLGFSHSKPDIAIPFWKHIAEYLVGGKIKPLAYVIEQGLDSAKVNEVLDRYRDGKVVTQTHFHVSES
ncbi:putative alcohol dehydrogenase [Paraphaeosphaeria sporulosa]|uniref:Putative alcohol dehydrogenase n=1 Tax=Paraphaeosphaeria sporulosa TaxID=1460663 RepID=A0A177C3V8_9PLEO|nr:putative alcohol dehydrogenase [Paraphaeosphaeria sporulosa]OAG02424.1 putative alcohol dehydrogenase [Paraphaeosphaeria sporulosa]